MLMKIVNEYQVSAFIFLVHFTPGNLRANNTLIVSRKFGGIQLVRHIRYVFILLIYTAYCVMVTSIRVGWGPRTFFSTHGNQLPSLSGVHGLKDFLSSDHLVKSFDGISYTYGGSVLKSNFYHKTTQEDGHYRENPSNHELLTDRGGDCRASKKMFRGLLPPYSVVSNNK